jgi:hypothetical protein
LRQRWNVGSEISNALQTSATVLPSLSIRSASRACG